jgi:hypothetical protein
MGVSCGVGWAAEKRRLAPESEDCGVQNDGAGGGHERDGNVAEMLGHADAHGGADPAGDCIEPAGDASALGHGGGGSDEGWKGDESDGIE